MPATLLKEISYNAMSCLRTYLHRCVTLMHIDTMCICSALIMAGLCSLVFPAYTDTREIPSAEEVILVGGDHAFPPYEFLDSKGRPAGYNVDLIRAVAEIMDLKIEIRLGPWSQARRALENREIDVLMGIFYSEERGRLIDFSVPHSIVHHAIFIRKEYEDIKSLEDLKGKEIIVQKGDIMHDYAIQQDLSEKLILVDSPDDALRLLASGKNHCTLLLERQGLFLARKFRLTNIITAGPPFYPNEYCFAVPKGDHELLVRLDEGLRIIKATGSYREIFNKWLGGLHPTEISPIIVLRWVSIVAGLLFTVLTGMFFWSWSLRKNIRIATRRLSQELIDRRHIQDALEKETAFSTTLVQTSPTYYVAIDAQGKTIMMNETLLQALGYSQDEVKCMDYLKTFVPEPEQEMLSKVFEKIVHLRDSTVSENHILTKDGRHLLVEWHGRPVFKTNGELEYFFGVGIDITERKQSEEERQRLENRLQQSYKMEALGTLAGGIAHDFNNILSSVLGFTELAKIKLAKGKRIEKELDEVLNAGARARDLVKQILTFSRQSGIRKSPTDMTSMIKETLKFLRASLPTTIEIRHHLPSYETTVMADPTQIHQVIMNLCTNAAYAMKDKGGVIDIRISEKELADKSETEFKGQTPGRYLQLSVSDTGSGIPEDIIDRIFDPFFTTKERGKGTGMGLSVVHGIIHDLGGAISVYSKPGKGTAFHLLFPRYAGKRFEQLSPHSILTMGKGRILFVDDEKGVIESGKEILESIGYTITPTTSASEALEIFRSDPDSFDLVLTDMTMPKMTGIELSKQMLAIRPDIPIILCTGSDIGTNPELIHAAGIKKMVMKPLTTNELAEAVYNALNPVEGQPRD